MLSDFSNSFIFGSMRLVWFCEALAALPDSCGSVRLSWLSQTLVVLSDSCGLNIDHQTCPALIDLHNSSIFLHQSWFLPAVSTPSPVLYKPLESLSDSSLILKSLQCYHFPLGLLDTYNPSPLAWKQMMLSFCRTAWVLICCGLKTSSLSWDIFTSPQDV